MAVTSTLREWVMGFESLLKKLWNGPVAAAFSSRVVRASVNEMNKVVTKGC